MKILSLGRLFLSKIPFVPPDLEVELEIHQESLQQLNDDKLYYQYFICETCSPFTRDDTAKVLCNIELAIDDCKSKIEDLKLRLNKH